MRKTRKLITLMAAFAACSACAVLSINNVESANADTVAIQAHGASVRLENSSGLRFLSSVAQEYAEGYEIGTLIIPKVVLGANTLNHNDDAADEVDVQYLNIAKTQWSNKAVAALENFDYDENRFYFNAVLTDIPNTDYGTVLVARTYAVKDGVYIYGEPVERSIAEVAAKAMQNGEESDQLVDYVDLALGENTPAISAKAMFVGAGETTLNVTGTNGYAVTWKSSNEEVATVDNDGVLTAIANGKTTITGTLGSNTFTTDIQVGEALEGKKVIDVKANAGSLLQPENKNTSTVEVINDVTVFGAPVVKHTTTGGNYHTAMQITDTSAFANYKTVSFNVYGWVNYKNGSDYYLRVKYTKKTGGYDVWNDCATTAKQKLTWTEVTLDVSDIDTTKPMYIQHGSSSTPGEGWRQDYIYVSDIYGVEKPEELPNGDVVVSMKNSIYSDNSGPFKAKNTNSTVVYSEDYAAFGAGMAKVTANIHTQAYGWYCQSLDVSAYSQLTFKVFRPAGDKYYVRVKTGEPTVLINSDATKAKDAGVWYTMTVNVADISNKNLNNFYIQFGTDTVGNGVPDTYIYISDIYGIK